MACLHNLPRPGRLVKKAQADARRQWWMDQAAEAAREREARERAERQRHAAAFHPAYRTRDGHVRIAEDV